jgi:hypothetical protein
MGHLELYFVWLYSPNYWWSADTHTMYWLLAYLTHVTHWSIYSTGLMNTYCKSNKTITLIKQDVNWYRIWNGHSPTQLNLSWDWHIGPPIPPKPTHLWYGMYFTPIKVDLKQNRIVILSYLILSLLLGWDFLWDEVK